VKSNKELQLVNQNSMLYPSLLQQQILQPLSLYQKTLLEK